MGDDNQRLTKVVEVLAEKLLRFRRGEHLLVYFDRCGQKGAVRSLLEIARHRGGRAQSLMLDPNASITANARILEQRIATGGFDVVCELSEQYFYRSPAWKTAAAVGARAYSLTGMDDEAIVRCVEGIDHDLMYQLGLELRSRLRRASSIRIATALGTDLRMRMDAGTFARVAHAILSRGSFGSFVARPAGRISGRTRATFLGGQLAFLGVPKSIEGTVVVDGFVSPPADIGCLSNPITLRVDQGIVLDVQSDAGVAARWKDWFQGQQMDIKHFCLGFHPRATFAGHILEAERLFGCLNVGIGEFPFHSDGVIRNPSLQTEKEVLLRDGSFLPTDLASYEKALKAPLNSDHVG